MRTHDGLRLRRRARITGFAASSGLAALIPAIAFAAAPSGPATAIAFDGSALVLAADGLWRSENGGTTWSALSSEPKGTVAALATHPDQPSRILAGLETGGVVVSEDGGTTWAELGSGLPDSSITALAVAAHAPDTFYAAAEGDGLWQSEDAGQTWSFAMDRPWLEEAEHDPLTLASVGSPSGMGGIWIYAGTEVGLTRVPDCFCRWQDVQPGDAMDALVAGEAPAPTTPLPAGEAVFDLAVAPDAPEVIHAATPSGLWRSEDAGVNWTQTSDAAAQVLAVDPADPTHIVAATASGLLSSRDGGLNWAEPSA